MGRRPGIGRSLLALWRVERDRDQGLRVLQVVASPGSRPNLEPLGVRVVRTTTLYPSG